MPRTARRRALVLALLACSAAAHAQNFLADFDDVAEGFTPTAFTSRGVTFSRGTWFPPPSVDLTFGIDDGSGDMKALGFGNTFSSPNVMSVGGYVTGPQSAFYRVHGWTAAVAGQLFTGGRVDVYYIKDFLGATAYLRGVRNGQVVSEDSFVITNPNPFEALHTRLSIEGPLFDELRFEIFGGPPGGDRDGLLAIFDNVGLTIPAPATALLLALAMPPRRGR